MPDGDKRKQFEAWLVTPSDNPDIELRRLAIVQYLSDMTSYLQSEVDTGVMSEEVANEYQRNEIDKFLADRTPTTEEKLADRQRQIDAQIAARANGETIPPFTELGRIPINFWDVSPISLPLFNTVQSWRSNVVTAQNKAPQERAANIYEATVAGQRGAPYPFAALDESSWDAYQKAAAQASRNAALTASSDWEAAQLRQNPFGVWGERQANRANLAQQDANRQASLAANQRGPVDQSQQAAEWEKMRQTLLGELRGDPAQWVQRSRLEQAQNPYGQISNADELSRINENLKVASQEEKDARQAFDAVAKRVTDDATLVNTDELAQAKDRYELAVARRQGLQTLSGKTWNLSLEDIGQRVAGTEGPMAQQGPITFAPPTVPEEIRGFLQGGFGSPTIIPSAQQWNALSPTGKEQFTGYQRTIGESPADTMWSIARSLPNAPDIANYWRPARQR